MVIRLRTAVAASAAPTTTRRATRTASGWSTPRSRPVDEPRSQPSNAQELGLHIGDDVEHPAFGEGVIIDISGIGEKAEAVINFAGVGTKHLALAWAPLKKLHR